MQRHKMHILNEGKFIRNDYFYYEKEVELLINAVKGILAERDDPRNKDRFLAPVVSYVTEDSECSVWSRAREIIKEFEDGTKRT
jgi:hypothetical protein